MLIGSDGSKLGIKSIEDALATAKSASLDLVQVSHQDANPTVCKLLDYGKHLFEKKKIDNKELLQCQAQMRIRCLKE